MRPQLLFRKIHKWAGLILGIQILLWFLSGFLMSWMPIEEIHGDHLMKPQTPAEISLNQLDFSALSNQLTTPVRSIKVKPWLGQTVLEVQTNLSTALFDTTNLQRLTPINEATVRKILAANLSEELIIDSITRLTETPNEARGRAAPLWQVQLKGAENARIYVSEQNGEITAKRTDRWRLFDFLWMLHIMDYDEREDFNHPLLYLTALSALLFTLTGFVLLVYGFKKKKKPNLPTA